MKKSLTLVFLLLALLFTGCSANTQPKEEVSEREYVEETDLYVECPSNTISLDYKGEHPSGVKITDDKELEEYGDLISEVSSVVDGSTAPIHFYYLNRQGDDWYYILNEVNARIYFNTPNLWWTEYKIDGISYYNNEISDNCQVRFKENGDIEITSDAKDWSFNFEFENKYREYAYIRKINVVDGLIKCVNDEYYEFTSLSSGKYEMFSTFKRGHIDLEAGKTYRIYIDSLKITDADGNEILTEESK